MAKITLYHGTPDQIVEPTYGLGDNERDSRTRQKMKNLIDSDANEVTKVFSTLFER